MRLSAYLLIPAALVVVTVVTVTSFASASIPFGVAQPGTATFYNNAGFGACGTSIDAATQDLVAVSSAWWTAANPNSDPLCQGVSVRLTYHGQTITVPVEDKCPTCDAGHIDLSQPVFARLA